MLSAFVLLWLGPAACQMRCKLGQVKRSDGEFSLGNCDEVLLFGEKIGDSGAAALARSLASNTRTRVLDLWSNDIGAQGAIAIARALETNTKLDKLYLNENNIGHAGVEALAKALASRSTVLTTLWLSRNKLGDAGAQALAASLSGGKARRLQVLDLWDNGISSVGGAALATALRTNNVLLTLEIRGNALGDAGAKAFAELMPVNRVLSTLDLSSNGVSPAGAATLLAGLKVAIARPYLLLFVEHVPHMQATSWEQQGHANAP